MKKGLALCVVLLSLLLAIGCAADAPSSGLQYVLDVQVAPPGGGFVDVPGNEFQPGVEVTVTATPAAGYTFDHWDGDASGSASSISIIMDSDRSIVANFTQLPQFFSGISIDDVLESTATVSWDAKAPATYTVQYGLTETYGSVASDTVVKQPVDWGRMTLSGLLPKTTYHLRIVAIDQDGKQAVSGDMTLTTLSAKGVYSARLFPFLPQGSLPSVIERLNTSLYNGSSEPITVTKIEFVDGDGLVFFTLPTSDDDRYTYRTLGRDDLPEIWISKRLDAGGLLFTGIEFMFGPTPTEAQEYLVLWHYVDTDGQEHTVAGTYSDIP